MTNETNYRTKANAVFFAAIMVVSMVAVGFAAAPAAAAGSDEVTISYDAPTDGATIITGASPDPQVTVSVDSDASENFNSSNVGGDNLSFIVDGTGVVETIDITGDNITPGDSQTYTFDGGDASTAISGLDAGSYEHQVAVTDSNGDIVSDSNGEYTSGLITLNVVDEGYSPDNPFQGQEVTFTNDTIDAGEEYDLRRVTASEGGEVTNSQFVDTLVADEDDSVTIDTEGLEANDYFVRGGSLETQPSLSDTFEVRVQTLTTEFEDDTVEDDETTNLEIDSNRGEYSLNVSADGDLDDEELEAIFNTTGDFTVENPEDDDDEITLVDVQDSDELETNFTDIDTGEYEFTFESVDTDAEDTASIEVVAAGEGGVEFAESSYDVSQGDIAEITVELEDTQNGYVVIGDAEDDNYQANISITDGVDDADDADGEVTILFNTYTAGDDDTSVTIVEAEDEDDEAVLEDQDSDAQSLEQMLDTGDYEIISAAQDNPEDAFDNEDDVSSLLIEERTPAEMNLWRTTGDAQDDLADALDDDDEDAVEAVNTAVEDGAVTETDTIAIDAEDNSRSDILVHQITAGGLEGVLSSTDGETATEQLYEAIANVDSGADGDNATSLVLEEQNPGRNADPKTVDVSALSDTEFEDAFTVVYDDETSNYYVLLDVDELPESQLEKFEDGDEYEVEFTVQDERLLQGSGDEFEDDEHEDAYESANGSFDVEEAEADFDVNNDDEIEATATEDATVTGTANVAPSTEFSVRLRSTDDTSPRFTLTDDEVTLNDDGTFEASFDLSDQAANDTFEATFRQAAFDDQDAVDGVIVEDTTDDDSTDDDSTDDDSTDDDSTDDDSTDDDSTDDDSTDDSADDDSSADDSTDDDSSDDSSSEDDSTEDDTPGFGAIVALVALIAAALLATRRNE